jgi:hypothetical protein
MDEMTFEEKESKVLSDSMCYESSAAFRAALTFIELNNVRLYRKLIEMEYNEAFG